MRSNALELVVKKSSAFAFILVIFNKFNCLKLNEIMLFNSMFGSIEVTVSKVLENAQSSIPNPPVKSKSD